MEAWKQRSDVFVLKKKHAPAFNLTQLARFPYKSERESTNYRVYINW